MKTCPKCEMEYNDGLMFCPQCGQLLEEKVETCYCGHCGKKIETKGEFCPFCGQALKLPPVKDTAVTGGKTNYTYYNQQNVANHSTGTSQTNAYNAKKVDTSSSIQKPGFFSKEYLFSTTGRRGRWEYLKVAFFWGLISGFIGGFIVGFTRAKNPYYIYAIIGLIFFYPFLCNTIKRMHDLNHSSEAALIICVLTSIIGLSQAPEFLIVINLCIGCYLLFWKGTVGPNEYGDDPITH